MGFVEFFSLNILSRHLTETLHIYGNWPIGRFKATSSHHHKRGGGGPARVQKLLAGSESELTGPETRLVLGLPSGAVPWGRVSNRREHREHARGRFWIFWEDFRPKYSRYFENFYFFQKFDRNLMQNCSITFTF